MRAALYLACHVVIAAAYVAAIHALGVPGLWWAYLAVFMLLDGPVAALCRAVVGR